MNSRTKAVVAAAGVAAAVLARNYYHKSLERPIAGDVVLITGGSRGLGLALARRFAREGCRVAICARDPEELGRAGSALSRFGAGIMTVRCDVTQELDVQQMIADVTARFGRIDILVNNAGQIQVGPIESVTLQDFEDAMNVMFWGVVHPTMALLPSLIKRRSGQIVNITSIGAKVSIPHLLPYSAAKHAAEGFSEGLRGELKDSGVTVTTIAPGLMRTGSYNAALFKGDQEAESAWFSVGASLPGVSMSADRAARQIVSAVRRGDAEKILTTPAAVLSKVHGLAPGLTQELVALAGNLLLPRGGTDKHSKPGWSLGSLKTPKMRAVLALGRMAARQLNQRMA
jgi:NAD(P)-dependent dehydrogenase (short-subunit alcohol dehydrogenase family)